MDTVYINYHCNVDVLMGIVKWILVLNVNVIELVSTTGGLMFPAVWEEDWSSKHAQAFWMAYVQHYWVEY